MRTNTTVNSSPAPRKITISTYNSLGFAALYKRTDKQLNDLEIEIKPKDKFNKNQNAIVDKACQELENEIRKIRPEGGKINQVELAAAILALNSKLQRHSKLSAYEMHTARNLETGDNLHLSDKTLREEQLRKRKSTQSAPPPIKTILLGDTVTQVSSQPKHKVLVPRNRCSRR